MPLFAGRYELGPVLGQGGMAEVRAGRDTRLERAVAIKIMRPELAHQPLVRARFEAEARLAARLIHPHVVAVFDSGEDGGLPFIVMERLPGTTLHDQIARGPLPEPAVRQLAVEMLSALQAAHSAGILHRDVKPANVLDSGDGHWKVADFGIAKALEVDHGDMTATGLVLGTPAYLAPERRIGAPATVASDVYAAGVVLYEALTGHRPAPPSGALPSGADPALTAAIERSLAMDPSDRFWSATEMAAAVTRAGPPPTTIMPPVPGAGSPDPIAASWAPSPAPTAVIAPAPPTEVQPAGIWDPAWNAPPGRLVELRRRVPTAGPAVAATAVVVLVLAAIISAFAFAPAGSAHRSPPTTVSTLPPTTTTLAPPTTAVTTPAPPAHDHGGPGHGDAGGGGGGKGDGGDG